MRRSELKPGNPLERKSGLKRSAGPRPSSLKSSTGGKGKGREGGSEWRDAVLNGPCVMCVAFRMAWSPERWGAYWPQVQVLDAHHLIPKGTLIREGHAAHIHDARNGAPVCRYHHSRHHAYVERIPRRLLPAAVFEFAAELGLEAILDREYPATVRRVTNEREAA